MSQPPGSGRRRARHGEKQTQRHKRKGRQMCSGCRQRTTGEERSSEFIWMDGVMEGNRGEALPDAETKARSHSSDQSLNRKNFTTLSAPRARARARTTPPPCSPVWSARTQTQPSRGAEHQINQKTHRRRSLTQPGGDFSDASEGLAEYFSIHRLYGSTFYPFNSHWVAAGLNCMLKPSKQERFDKQITVKQIKAT